MWSKTIKTFFIFLFFYFSSSVLYAQEELKSLGKFKDWESFVKHIEHLEN